MVNQLLVLLKLVFLLNAACQYNPTLTQLATCTNSSIADSVSIANSNQGFTSQGYSIVRSDSNNQIAIAINQFQARDVSDWSLSVKSANITNIVIGFRSINSGWTQLTCFVWTVSRPDIIFGYYAINKEMNQTCSQQIVLKTSIANFNSSLVLTFVNGLKVSSNSSISFEIRATKVYQNSFLLNLTNTLNIRIQMVAFSYVIFSPTKAGFQSFGDLMTIQNANTQKHYDLYATIPFTPFKFYGFTGFQSSKKNLNLTSDIDEDYVLSATCSASTLYLQYAYFAPLILACPNCPNALIWNKTCLAECPSNTIQTTYGDTSYCQHCSQKLNLEFDPNSQSCVCKAGFKSNDDGQCQLIEKKEKGIIQKSEDLIVTNKANKSESTVETSTLSTNSVYPSLSSVIPSFIPMAPPETMLNPSKDVIKNTLANETSQTVNRTVPNGNSQSIIILTAVPNKTDEKSKEIKVTVSSKVTSIVTQSNKNKPQQTIKASNPAPQYSIFNQPVFKTDQLKSPPTLNFLVSSALQPANCANISNSIAIGNKCVCTIGYINISNNCIALTALGTPLVLDSIQSTKTALKIQGIPCPINQQYSITESKCVCIAGYVLNQNACVSFCPSNEVYDYLTRSCSCISGYGRINNQCVPCQKNIYSKGNEVCYPLANASTCRSNYIQTGKVCLSCPQISLKILNNGRCNVCQNGLIYNGSSCICLQGNKIMNSTCISQKCGNGKLDGSQTCDDGNNINGDGCSSQCLTEMNFFCTGSPSNCSQSICGNGAITGGEQCDDNNTINGDGCSSICLVQFNYTCLDCPSSCFPSPTGNLTLVSLNSNTNSIFIVLETPKNHTFSNSALTKTFIESSFMKTGINGVIYCQQQTQKLNRFDCLLIFPKGIPNIKFYVAFRYNFDNATGNLFVSLSGLQLITNLKKGIANQI